MPQQVRVQLNITQLNKLMRGPESLAEVARRAHRLAAAAGPGHKVIINPHRWTGRAFVEQEDAHQARKDPGGTELLRAVGTVGGG